MPSHPNIRTIEKDALSLVAKTWLNTDDVVSLYEKAFRKRVRYQVDKNHKGMCRCFDVQSMLSKNLAIRLDIPHDSVIEKIHDYLYSQITA